ncbi:MAG: hypothetical protein ACK482_01800 [Aphanizomenon sp.]|jgi:hypothetical protein
MLHKTICQDCAFYVKLDCTHPDESGVNCATVNFCSSFTPAVEIDSPCVSFGNDDKVGWVDTKKPNNNQNNIDFS